MLVVLDRRIASRQYGSAFLSLAGLFDAEAAVREMPWMVEEWLARKGIEPGSGLAVSG